MLASSPVKSATLLERSIRAVFSGEVCSICAINANLPLQHRELPGHRGCACCSLRDASASSSSGCHVQDTCNLSEISINTKKKKSAHLKLFSGPACFYAHSHLIKLVTVQFLCWYYLFHLLLLNAPLHAQVCCTTGVRQSCLHAWGWGYTLFSVDAFTRGTM